MATPLKDSFEPDVPARIAQAIAQVFKMRAVNGWRLNNGASHPAGSFELE